MSNDEIRMSQRAFGKLLIRHSEFVIDISSALKV